MANNQYSPYDSGSVNYRRAVQSSSSASLQQQWETPRSIKVPRRSDLRQTGLHSYHNQNQLQTATLIHGYNHTPAYTTTSPDVLDPSLRAVIDDLDPSPSRLSLNGTQNPIVDFYQRADRTVAPWNPLMADPSLVPKQPFAGSGSTVHLSVPNFDYHRCRNNVPASETESAESALYREDSGYGSYGTQTASVHSHGFNEPVQAQQDCPEITVPLDTMQFSTSNDQQPDPTHLQPNNQAQQVGTRGSSPRRQAALKCPHCKEVLRCKSEHKKHVLRHERPHKCDVPGCSRDKGFTTVNDLDRHRKSVHQMTGRTKSYKCAANKCRNKQKIWPRLDNFKQHVQRMHAEEQEDDLIRRSELDDTPAVDRSATPRPETLPLDNTLAGMDVGSNLEYPPPYDNTPELCISPDQGTGDWRSHETSGQPVALGNGQLGAAFSPTLVDARPADQESNLGQRHPGYPHSAGLGPMGPRVTRSDTTSTSGSLCVLAAVATDPASYHHRSYLEPPEYTTHTRPQAESSQVEAPSPPSEEATSPSAGANAGTTPHPANETTIEKVLLQVIDAAVGLEKNSPRSAKASQKGFTQDFNHGNNAAETDEEEMTREEVMKAVTMLAKLASKNKGKAIQLPESLPKPVSAAGGKSCRHCGKVFPRDCELNKHMKRHKRPYGCTFPRCSKAFGSKNDWKRHESTRHFQNEAWRCLVSNDGTKECQCAQLIHNKELFRTHLQDEHQIKDEAKQEEWAEKCHIGRNGHHQYWCGFCRELHKVEKVGIQAWDERFNHIDQMFKDKNISEWLCLESNKTKGEEAAAADRDDSTDGDTGSPHHPDPANLQTSNSEAPREYTPHVNVSRKRPREDGSLGGPASKRRHEMRETMHYCCDCGYGPMLSALYKSCMQCSHERCEDCDHFPIPLLENETAERGLGQAHGPS